MLKKLLFTLLTLVIFISNPPQIFAVNIPFSVTNNKYGIHITDESDIENAAKLVNSNGGDWGYVTFVIRTDERDTKRWQNFFDKLRIHHLIPIVRIASKIGTDGWEKLNKDEIDGWVSFLNSLNWVIQNRYVVIGNEVNLGKEWGGNANPQEYTEYLIEISQKLKRESGEFFILPSGLDSQAKNNKTDMDENDYLIQMFGHNTNVFENIDGLSSHSYPYKPLGGESDKATLKHYEWELQMLKSLGVKKDLPVFITETGWMHGNQYSNENEISNYLNDISNIVWNDSKIVAITPFILKYTQNPFAHYSWTSSTGEPYKFYDTYKELAKLSGNPVQKESGEVVSYITPRFIKTEHDNLYGLVYIKNTGQSIWNGYEPITLTLKGIQTQVKPITVLSDVDPGESTLAVYSIK